ncbi:Pantothenate synthetase [bacterium HR40]|nr:Pantothenate synthetase [bacterium HR40]
MIATTGDLEELRRQIGLWRGDGLKIGFVPTMGYLHDGHLALVRRALALADRVVVSIFVNPTQFAPHEDFERYPRDERGDLAKLEREGTHLVYLPTRETMYFPDHATWVTVEGLSEGLCGITRPHFFRGVATVVTKLFNRVQPDVAVFGEKDYQQLLVVRRLVRDLDLPIEIVGHPTVREPDGLAMSSRNAYLSAEERRIAPALFRILRETAARLARGAEAAAELEAARQALLEAGFTRVEYVELRHAETLAPLERASEGEGRLLAAVHLGGTRLIDNVPVRPDEG